MLDQLSKKFLDKKNEIAKLESELDDIKASIYSAMIDKISAKPQGSVTEKTGLFSITITNSVSYKVDQKKAEQHPYLFKKKYEFSKEIFENAKEEERNAINEIVTTTPIKPQFKIQPQGE